MYVSLLVQNCTKHDINLTYIYIYYQTMYYLCFQVRKMREHTITTHHLSHQHSLHASDPQHLPHPSVHTHRPPLHGPVLMGGSGLYQPINTRPVAVGGGTSGMSDTTGLGLPTYLPSRQEPGLQMGQGKTRCQICPPIRDRLTPQCAKTKRKIILKIPRFVPFGAYLT